MIGILGEALIDLIEGTGGGKEPCFYPHVGGCALNTATAASRLGSSVLYIGKLSADMFGLQMQQHFSENGVAVYPPFCNVRENSMLAFASLDKDGAASYAFYIAGTTVEALRSYEIEEVFSHTRHIDFLHIGSVALALERSGEEILTALKRLDSRPYIFLDPNVRPTVIEDLSRYRERLIMAISLSAIVKLSCEDLALVFPGVPEREGVAKLIDCGAAHVVLTRGKDGLSWYSANGIDVWVPAIDTKVVDTVGAGDTVSGAILCYLDERGLTTPDGVTTTHAREALTFAAAAADITCSRKGANPPWRRELTR